MRNSNLKFGEINDQAHGFQAETLTNDQLVVDGMLVDKRISWMHSVYYLIGLSMHPSGPGGISCRLIGKDSRSSFSNTSNHDTDLSLTGERGEASAVS